MNSPLIILVRPQMGENIGAVARAMSNFGLSELRLVAPRDGWPNPRAKKTASGAESLIKEAKLYPDFASATADIQIAYATTARPRDMEKRVVTPEEAMREIVKECGDVEICSNGDEIASPHPKIALVFGPERTGLENEEIAWCDTLITIPTARNASLNLAQSAVILGYEWWKACHPERSAKRAVKGSQAAAQDPSASFHSAQDDSALAAKSDWQGLFAQLESYLDEVNYYRVADKKTVMWQNVRNMLLRGAWSEQEVRTFRGLLRALWERRTKNTPPGINEVN